MKTNNFDQIAPWYDKLARLVFGDQIQSAQTHFLEQLPAKGKLLIIGGGSGWILEEVIRLRPALQIDYVEASVKMLAQCKARVGDIENVSLIHGTEGEIPKQQYDVIITNFFLDMFQPEKLKDIMHILSAHLRPGGLWFCADFQKTEKWRHQLLIGLMHFFFGVVSRLESRKLLDFHSYFIVLKFELISEEKFHNGMIFSRVYQSIAQ